MVRRLAVSLLLLLLLAALLLAATMLLLSFHDRAQFVHRPASNLSVVLFGQLFPFRPFAIVGAHDVSVRVSQRARYANLEAKSQAKGRVSR